jgi:hypothetical protein
MTPLAAAGAVVAVLSAGPAAAPGTVSKEVASAPAKAVLGVVERLNNAGVMRDLSELEGLYSKQYFHTNADGTVWRRDRVLASYAGAPPRPPVESQSLEDTIVEVAGGTAVVNGLLILGGHLGEQVWERRYRVTWILTREDNGWKVLSSHACLTHAP